jgi:hypothetical protein
MAAPTTRPRGGRGRLNPGGAPPMPGRGRRAPGAGNGGTTAPAPGGGHPGNPGGGQGNGNAAGGNNGQGGKTGLGGQALTGPGGRQLEARVQSGKITQTQAQRTMAQRQTLAKALGPNWRDKLQVGGKSFAQVNAGLKKNPGNPKLAALRKKLLTNRSSVLTTARAQGKGKGAGEGKGSEGAPQKKGKRHGEGQE